MTEYIKIVGARTNNLKNISVEIPKNAITVITGLSGSGKSSLAFDTIFAEGQRRYVESMSSYVRQFMSNVERADFDYIEGLAPAIAIDQKTSSRNPRSTVATATEIYDFLRLLFSRIGTPYCPNCNSVLAASSIEEIAESILTDFNNDDKINVFLYAPVVVAKKGEHKYTLKEGKKKGVIKVLLDGVEIDIDEAINLEIDKLKHHSIDFYTGSVSSPISNDQSRQVVKNELLTQLEKAFKYKNSTVKVRNSESQRYYSLKLACAKCGTQLNEIEPRIFSFNNPEGACEYCHGIGSRMVAQPDLVIPNLRLTVNEGAIRPWSRTTGQSSLVQKSLEKLAQKYSFSLDTPVENLDKKTVDLLLFGESDEITDRYEGVIPNLERRYRETDSEYLRTEIEKYMRETTCEYCEGNRLRKEVLSIRIANKNIIDITSMSIEQAATFFDDFQISDGSAEIAKILCKEITTRLHYLIEVGLGYLTLNRTTSTLAGGEAQRIRLSNQLGSGLSGVVYILDEPSIGLHARDHDKLLNTVKELKKRGNTVVIVEHDAETMRIADYIIDMGPGAGEMGGEIIATGTYDEICQNPKSITGKYLARSSASINKTKSNIDKFLTIKGANGHNLKNISAKIPLNKLVCVTGVSGSGKSTLIEDTLAVALSKKFHNSTATSESYTEITGDEHLDNIIDIDQSPIGRTPRSNPATYTGVLSPIRELFANTKMSLERGYDASRFSFNLKGGRCENCRGDGQIKIEMNFLPDVYVPCTECRGKRYNPDTLEIKYKSKDISDVLSMTVSEANKFFVSEEEIKSKLEILEKVGLGYIKLGQSATTLSGGEAQRIKLAAELSRRETGNTLYILDEPTTGLHFADIERLLSVLRQLVERGNSVILIEHNTDVIRNSDYIIDMGPDGGEGGGEIVAVGTPYEISHNSKSITGQWLK